MDDFSNATLADIPIAVLDTETTGLYPEMGHRVVEIGVVRLEQWREVGQLSTLLQPNRAMDGRASAVNGITDEDLVNQPSFDAVADELLALLDGALIVAHNASFDAGFLGMELYINGRTQPQQPALPNPWLCTLQLARRNFHFGRNNLDHIAHQLGVRSGRSHRALTDVYTTAEILKRMVNTLSKQQFHTVNDLILAQGGPIYAPTPPEIFLPEPIPQAIANGRSVQILYKGNNGESSRVITPLYATEYQSSAYLVAHCHLRWEQRTFRLDRIFNARLV